MSKETRMLINPPPIVAQVIESISIQNLDSSNVFLAKITSKTDQFSILTPYIVLRPSETRFLTLKLERGGDAVNEIVLEAIHLPSTFDHLAIDSLELEWQSLTKTTQKEDAYTIGTRLRVKTGISPQTKTDTRRHDPLHPVCTHCRNRQFCPAHIDHQATQPCPFGCGVLLPQCMVVSHATKCAEREVLVCTQEGCLWIGKHYDADQHMTIECPNTTVIHCPESCGWCGIADDLDSHLLVCPNVQISCQLCGIAYLRRDAQTHPSTCAERIVSCKYCDSTPHCAWEGPVRCQDDHPCVRDLLICKCHTEVPRHKLAEHQLACGSYIPSLSECPICRTEHLKGRKRSQCLKHLVSCVQSASRLQSRCRGVKLSKDKRMATMKGKSSSIKTLLIGHHGFVSGVFEWDFEFRSKGFSIGVAPPKAPGRRGGELGSDGYPGSIAVRDDGMLMATRKKLGSHSVPVPFGSDEFRRTVTLRIDLNTNVISWLSGESRVSVALLHDREGPLVPAVTIYGRGSPGSEPSQVDLTAFRRIIPQSIDQLRAPDSQLGTYSELNAYPALCSQCWMPLSHTDVERHQSMCQGVSVMCPSPQCTLEIPSNLLLIHWIDHHLSRAPVPSDPRDIGMGGMVLEFSMPPDDLCLEIPTKRGLKYSAIIDWGDHTVSPVDSPDCRGLAHRYGSPGTYIVRVIGHFPRIHFNSSTGRYLNPSASKLVRVLQLGSTGLTDLDTAFKGCSNLLEVRGYADLSAVTSMRRLFEECVSLVSVESSDWDVSSCMCFSGTFYRCVSLTQVDVGRWDMSNARDIGTMFFICKSLPYLDVSRWDTSRVCSTQHIFCHCCSLTVLDVRSWDMSKVRDLSSMFSHCSKLEHLDVGGWDVSSAVDIKSVFSYCSSLTSLNVCNWNVSKVKSLRWTFGLCRSLVHLDVSKWDVGNVEDTYGLFTSCRSLVSVDLHRWNTSKVQRMNRMFSSCVELVSIGPEPFFIGEDTETEDMFQNCKKYCRI
eukprot:gnl/Dysnectes_brevis/9896_a18867_169.p1 GENE.gnl/Dysnectes_brevis/9896_a18867_169~~gnl/Dysnectes_brevis/9896_a18867_169.p1  ORF type:complete len:994 (+),score=111.50 gnl/Dysnectes_brevis/9896_a18867_169:2-2983(+)